MAEARRRGNGLGRALIEELERIARDAHIAQLLLLTQTASEFFLGLGYQEIERSSVPVEIRVSEESRTMCPASAACMVKKLAMRVEV